MIRNVEEHLLNPPPGSAAARARDFGIDLTLLIGRLKLTPTERLQQLQRAMIEIETMRSGVSRQSSARPDDTSRSDLTAVDSVSG
jgi:hypothetical protein